MKKLLIFGAGGHGKSVMDAAIESDKWGSIAFADDSGTTEFMGFPVVGSFKEAVKMSHVYNEAIIATGNNSIRKKWCEILQQNKFTIPIIRHPFSFVSRFASIGAGTVIMPGVSVNAGSQIGKGCILNTGCTVDHDCKIEDYVHLSPGSHLCGRVSVGEESWICANATISNTVSVCRDCVVAAGAAVVKDISSGKLWAGVPATRKK